MYEMQIIESTNTTSWWLRLHFPRIWNESHLSSAECKGPVQTHLFIHYLYRFCKCGFARSAFLAGKALHSRSNPQGHFLPLQGCRRFIYLAAAFFFAAQRFLAAAAMRARPSGERTRFFFCGRAIGELAVTLGGRPAFRLATVTADPAARRARACLSVAISASMEERMSVSAMQKL